MTGAASGIGGAVAGLLADYGASVAAIDRNADGVERVRSTLTHSGDGKPHLALAADVTDDDGVQNALRRVSAELGEPTILVNSAGVIARSSLVETPMHTWSHLLDVNVGGYVRMLRAVIPMMATAGGGAVVQIASIAAHVGYGYPTYTATKGAVLALTRQLAVELAPQRIRINSVSPGAIETAINQASMSDQQRRRALERSIPLGRVGVADDIAKAVAFLVSDQADYITGTDLVVDGGLISALGVAAPLTD